MRTEKKAKNLQGQIKTGRTHMMDAMPLDFHQELMGWSAQLKSCKTSLTTATKRMMQLPQGGTAIGTGVNSHKGFQKHFVRQWRRFQALKLNQLQTFSRD